MAGALDQIRRLKTIHLFMLVPWIGVIVAARQSIRDNSFLWHIQAGVLQLDQGSVLTTDPFSFTFLGEAWRTQSWVADILYAWLHTFGGLGFVPWLIAIAALAVVSLVGRHAYLATESLSATAIALFFLAWIGVSFLSPRPVVFSYVLIALLALVLERESSAWSVPLILWVWAAVHGSFVLGVGLVVLHGIARRRRIGKELAVSMALISLTAHGLGVWVTLGRFVENRPALDLITEWAPPRLTGPSLAPYLVLITLVVWGASTQAIDRRDLIIVVPFLLFGLTATRSVYPAVIVVAPFVSAAVGDRLDRWTSSGTVHWGVNGAVAAIILVLPFLITPHWVGISEDRFPTDLISQLDGSPLFHDDVVGGFLIYARPEGRVFVDDRAELYGATHFRALVDARNARPGWDALFAEHDIGQALIQVNDGLVSVLELEGWSRRGESDAYVLLVPPGS